MGSSSNTPNEVTVVEGSLPRWVILLFFVAFALVAYLLYASYSQRQSIASAQASADQKTQALAAEIDTANSRIADLKGQLDVTSQKLGLTQDELAHARSLAQSIKKDQDTSDAQLRQQIGAVQADATTKIGQVSTQVNGTQTDLNATKADLASTKASLTRTIGDLGVQSGLIATNEKEVDELKHMGDRDIFDFTLTKTKKPQHIGPIQVQLTKIDAKHFKYTLNVIADDKDIPKRDKTVDEPVQFFVNGAKSPYEIVVFDLNKDQAKGYLSTPKGSIDPSRGVEQRASGKLASAMPLVKWPRPVDTAWPFPFFAQIFPLLMVFLFPYSCPAAQQPSAEIQQPIQSSSDLVVVDVSVLDKNGSFYSGLSQHDFHVLDNGIEKPVLFFAPVEAPAHVVILVETGPAVFLIHDEHMLALSSLVDGLAPDDQAALFSYADSARNILPFTDDKKALRRSIDESQYMVGMDRLNFYDSLRAVLDWLPPGPGKNTIVVLGTGLDDSPAGHWDLLERKLRANSVVIFAVGLGGPLRGDAPVKATKKKPQKKNPQQATDDGPTPAFARADEALRSLAQITGGRAYFPQAPDDFASAYREIAAAVRHQYVVGVAPDHDGSFHKLTIDVLDRSNEQPKSRDQSPAFRTLYREGYLAPAQ